jgi:hypothetical protein
MVDCGLSIDAKALLAWLIDRRTAIVDMYGYNAAADATVTMVDQTRSPFRRQQAMVSTFDHGRKQELVQDAHPCLRDSIARLTS